MPNEKLTRPDRDQIHTLYGTGMTIEVLGLMFGVHHSTIQRTLKGKTWTRDNKETRNESGTRGR